MLALFAYFLCSSFNLLWILFPRMNRLKKMLNGCQRVSGFGGSSTALNATDVRGSSFVVPFKEKWLGETRRPTVRLNMYYDKRSRDFGLLMDLLAESSGLVQPLRILSMFDRHFQALWRPRCSKSTTKSLIHCSQGVAHPLGEGEWDGQQRLCPSPLCPGHRRVGRGLSLYLKITTIPPTGFNSGHLGGLCDG